MKFFSCDSIAIAVTKTDRKNANERFDQYFLSTRFFPRWKEWEEMQATNMQFTLDEDQWDQDWASVLSLASQPGASLEQTHVFALAHIIRRPIIIYGVKFVRSFRGETLGLARFQGRLWISDKTCRFMKGLVFNGMRYDTVEYCRTS